MAHFKRKRHPNARAGCAMCKPHKKGHGANSDTGVHHQGFGKIKALIHAKEDQNNYNRN